MQPTLATARRLQFAFVVLLVVCVAQVAWWLIDQWSFTAETTGRTKALYEQSLLAAQALVDRGFPLDTVETMFPQIVAGRDGMRVDPDLLEFLEDERRSRINRYAWEGAFFLVVLGAAIGVLWSAVRSEVRLRRRQRNFVTAVTHELKSPLAAMRLSAETLEMRDADAETRGKLVRRLLASLDRMEGTVSNVLDTARIDEGKLPLAPRDVDLATLAADIVQAVRTTAESRNVDVRLQAAQGVSVHADLHALTAILRNLVDNALGAVSGIEGGLVTLSIEMNGTGKHVEVSDNGRGFDPDAAEKLFEKFYRPGDEMRREGRGTGLGLYIARELATASGATLTAHSDGRDRGATFRVSWSSVNT